MLFSFLDWCNNMSNDNLSLVIVGCDNYITKVDIRGDSFYILSIQVVLMMLSSASVRQQCMAIQ